MAVQRPPAGTIPERPGSYQFTDSAGQIIYVGKAKSLRSRVLSYFADPTTLAPRTAQMVAAATDVEWIEVRSELDALLLEHTLIQKHRPRFNIRLMDDKSYPMLAVTTSEEWPRVQVVHGAKVKGTRYFGPYAQTTVVRDTLDEVLHTFPVRTCTDAKFNRHAKAGRPCLLYDINKCVGPCVGAVERDTYDGLVGELCDFLDGKTDTVTTRVRNDMVVAAERLDFELAAKLRDRLGSLDKAAQRQEMVGSSDEDYDVFGVAGDDLEASVQIFHVRGGRVTGRDGFIVDKVEDLSDAGMVAKALEAHYLTNASEVPAEILVPDEPSDAALYKEWLTTERGAKVIVRVPRRGPKRALQATVVHNASQELSRHRLRRATDYNSRARALNELAEHLELPAVPLRIECYDMSHISGTDYVGSMVVANDGLPAKAEYRRFKVKGVRGNDDFAAMREVLTRRLSAYVTGKDKPMGERGKFSYPPQLLLVDGGKGQLGVATSVLANLGLTDEIPVAALAKRHEEVFVPGRSEPILLGRQSEALYLLQRLRDEAHRYAISFHRQLRSKRMTTSVLDDIGGLGSVRSARLRDELGGTRGVQAAPLSQLVALNWLPDKVAAAIYAKTHPHGSDRI